MQTSGYFWFSALCLNFGFTITFKPPNKMPGCAVFNCSSNSKYERDRGVGFFRFPNPEMKNRHKLWENFCKRKDFHAIKDPRICGRHFVGGKVSKKSFETNYNPTIHPGESPERIQQKNARKSRHDDCQMKQVQAEEEQNKRRRTSSKNLQFSQPNENDIESDSHEILPLDLEVQSISEENKNKPEMVSIAIQCDFIPENEGDRKSHSLAHFSFSRFNFDSPTSNAQTQVNHTEQPLELYQNDISPAVSEYFYSTQHGTTDYVIEEVEQVEEEDDDEESTEKEERSWFVGYESVKNDNKSMLSLTGINLENFAILFQLLEDASWRPRKRSLEDHLLLFLFKLKTGLPFSIISVIVGLHPTTVSRSFNVILEVLSNLLDQCIYWPSRVEVDQTMPPSFAEKYPDTRVIIDCTEFPCEVPRLFGIRNYLYSNYKAMHTVKIMIGIAPNGLISFLSKAYGGRASDAHITNDSGFPKKIEKKDLVLADKGFPYITTLADGAVILMPPRAKSGNQFEADEMDEAYMIASVCIHVERVIGRLKKYAIFTHQIPIQLLPKIDKIITVCAALVNIDNPVVSK